MNNKYKMLVMDMDGTLLTDDKRISDRNKKALKSAADRGVKIAISTGRIFASAKIYGEMIGVKTPIIASNGAYIREGDSDRIIHSRPLGEKNARDILGICQKYGLYCQLYTSDTIFTEKIIYSSANYDKWNRALPEDKRVKLKVVDKSSWDDVIDQNRGSILKALFTEPDAEKLMAVHEEISNLNVEITNSAYSSTFEVMDKGVTKGKAVEALAKYLNIDRQDVICMGDSENDISMVEYAGLGIAMENGSDEIKKASGFVTLSNEQDGVAYAIEKFIL